MTAVPDTQLDHRLDRIEEVLGEIHTQVKATNGRVTSLELTRAAEQGAAAQRRQSANFWPSIISAVIAAVSLTVAIFLAVLQGLPAS